MGIERLVGAVEIGKLSSVLPELIIFTLAFILFALDLFLKPSQKKAILPPLTAGGYIIALLSFPLVETGINFGGTYVVDKLSLIIKVFAILIALTVLAFSRIYFSERKSFYGEYYYIITFTLLGAMILASSYNLIVVYVALELVSVGFYILTALLRGSFISKEGAFKYLIFGGISIALASYGAVFMYIYSGSVDLREILTHKGEDLHYLILGLVFFMIGFASKVGAVPFHFWLPDAYEGAPTPVTAFMASVGKMAFFIPVIRVMPYISETFHLPWVLTVGAIAGITMLYGNAVALVQKNIKRLLAYSSVAHSGYFLAGIASASLIGVKAVVYFLIVYAIISAGAFLTVAYLEKNKDWSNRIQEFSGLRFNLPYLAFGFMVLLLAMLGVPPTVGFVGKALVFTSLSFSSLWVVILIMIIATGISTGYYLRLIVLMYMKDREKAISVENKSIYEVISLILLSASAVLLGVLPSIVWRFISESGDILFKGLK